MDHKCQGSLERRETIKTPTIELKVSQQNMSLFSCIVFYSSFHKTVFAGAWRSLQEIWVTMTTTSVDSLVTSTTSHVLLRLTLNFEDKKSLFRAWSNTISSLVSSNLVKSVIFCICKVLLKTWGYKEPTPL